MDILAFSEDRDRVLMGECKWSKKPVGVNILEELEEAFPHTGLSGEGRKPLFALFSRTGFTSKLLDLAKQRRDIILVHGLTVLSISLLISAYNVGTGVPTSTRRLLDILGE